ncbi:MAG: amidohydrolase family protein [Thermoleophilia bacterium]
MRPILLEGGTIRTLDPAAPVVERLSIVNGRIAADPAPDALRVDLQGRCVLPGLNDSHVHFPTWAVTRRELQLQGSREAVLARVAEVVPSVPPGRWLRGFGWTDLEPSLEALDAAISGGGLAGPLAHLLAITLGFVVLARLALRRFA